MYGNVTVFVNSVGLCRLIQELSVVKILSWLTSDVCFDLFIFLIIIKIKMEDLLNDDDVDYQQPKNLAEVEKDNESGKDEAKEDLYYLEMGEYEIKSHYRLRKEVYVKAIKEVGLDKNRALIIANAFQNHYYMG